MLLFEAGELGLGPAGHEVQQDRPHLVAEDDGAVVFIQDFQAETDGAFQLPANGDIFTEIQFQEAVVDRRVGRRDVKIVQVVPVLQHLGDLVVEPGRIEADLVGFREEHEAREMLAGLNVHVLIKTDMGQLRPEGDIQGQGQLQGRLRLVMGQNSHGGGAQISRD